MSSTDRVRQFRARQRAALEADPDAYLRPVDDLLAPSVREALAALHLDGQDAAVAKLAEQLAVTIDRARDQARAMRWLAPELLRVLGELGATPQARAKIEPATAGKPTPNWRDSIRQTGRTGRV